MLKVGITGQPGFIGTHLYNTLGLYPDEFTRIWFEDSFFDSDQKLNEFVSICDTIVHLAAMNRHNDPEVIYKTNIRLVRQIINSCETCKVTPHIIFSSSSQEEKENLYGKSKKEGRELFEKWADKNNAQFSGLIIPNVYGPFGNPFYNSVVATFCHQLTHGETPKIDIDSNLQLIYVSELIDVIIKKIREIKDKHNKDVVIETVKIGCTTEIKVSSLLKIIKAYNEEYFENGYIPCLDNPAKVNLFNTFVCYIDHSNFFPFHLKLNSDDRGSFVETIKLKSGGQVSFSTTRPGITRGNHFHTRKAERFAVIKGKARIDIRRIGTDKVFSFELNGKKPSFVDMPIWYTHNITNIGKDELYTIFWTNENYNPSDPDTYYENV
jgi:UDP-2-acetamido-2,6-beta-L-arabino-hexul-4-ose reductase